MSETKKTSSKKSKTPSAQQELKIAEDKKTKDNFAMDANHKTVNDKFINEDNLSKLNTQKNTKSKKKNNNETENQKSESKKSVASKTNSKEERNGTKTALSNNEVSNSKKQGSSKNSATRDKAASSKDNSVTVTAVDIALQQLDKNESITDTTELPSEEELPGNKKQTFFSKFKAKKITPLPLNKVKRFSPDIKNGLTQQQVIRRNAEQLINDVDQKYTKSYRSIFFGNIFTFFNFLCFASAAALIIARAPITDMVFLLTFTANIIIGITQEIKAKLAIEKLSLVSAPVAKVVRDGIEMDIPIKDIVLDDVILLSTGKQVPTDCILAEGVIEVNESLLTGESIPVKKEIGDILYAGSFISSGQCRVRAEKVGKANYIQTLTAKAKKYKKPNSELLRSLKLIMTVIGVLIVPITAFTFLNNQKVMSLMGKTTAEIIIKTAPVTIGMIPAGMFLLTSIALAVGVIRLSKNNTLVQDLYSLEMLARVDVLCLDKTGTITDGRMKVSDCMLINNNTNYTINEIMGAMLAALKDNNQTSIALYNHFGHSNVLKPLKILPFSSKRKLSAVTFSDLGTYLIGAPEFVMSSIPDKIDRLINQYASMGLRVLLLAQSPSQLNNDKVPTNVKPVALITIADNIREDAVQTIRWFKENDVAIKVISGDNPVTVSEVARRVGISNAEKYVSLEGLNEKEIISIANKYTVFGRVTPEQKAILVKALKAVGHTVAMTGDGVNDILALKEADCSISVASGSEAARNVSHLVLMDNNFSSMPKVVNEGRRVINNIQRSSSLYLMKTLFVAIFAIISIITAQEYPFTTTKMMLLETFIIGIGSTGLALQSNNNRVKGKFITYVVSRALPSAFIMIINVLALKLIKNVVPIESYNTYYETMATLAITFSALVIFFRICQPFNAYRGVLFSIVALLCVISVIYFKDTLDIIKLEWQFVLIIICLIQLDFPLSKWLFDIGDTARNRDNMPLRKF